jgi:hypothetical protein
MSESGNTYYSAGGSMKRLFVLALLLATAATVFAYDRCVVLEEAYQEG